jgi:mRNA interferase MazF
MVARSWPWTPGRGDLVSVVSAAVGSGAADGRLPPDGRRPLSAKWLPDGSRPALVVSPAAYSAKVGLVLLCAIAPRRSGYPFEVELPWGLPVAGVVLADRVGVVDKEAASVRIIGRAPDEVIDRVLARLLTLVAPGG